jgi:murein DD-endopeptidase MepM/ murein hydrolase activator NlpD
MMAVRKGLMLAAIALFVTDEACAQTLYKYRGDDGEWIYSDRPPDDGSAEETRQLSPSAVTGTLKVAHTLFDGKVEIWADNGYHAPVEVVIDIDRIEGIAFPDPDQELRWVVPPRSRETLLSLDILDTFSAPSAEYSARFAFGEPNTAHRPGEPYRVPYAVAKNFPITQAYPDVTTHDTPDSYYAVDVAMPIGTDIHAARGGVVFEVAGANFRSGLDRDRDGPAANILRILHDDGTYALYAHLNWNSIRVRPGDRVERGEYIADSGNTGFSSGPHLHFAVLRNGGMRPQSVPVRFAGSNSSAVVPATGNALAAY